MSRLNLAQRFFIGSLIIIAIGMTGIGFWVSRKIEDGIVHRTASTTALYVDSLIAAPLQDLSTSDQLSQASVDHLDWLIQQTPLGQQVALFRVWDKSGRVVYSTAPDSTGVQPELDDEFEDALKGEVTADVGTIEGDVALAPGLSRDNLLEIYSPVRGSGTNDVIAVAEFYYGASDIQDEISSARRESWLVVGAAALAIYLLLAAFVQRASNTILRQQRALGAQVEQLTELLDQNKELNSRVRGASARTTALNERVLRRIAAEMHDGPAQDISLALLKMDQIADRVAAAGTAAPAEARLDVETVQSSLRRALQEVRAASTELMLPQLNGLGVAGVVDHAVRMHRRRTKSEVAVSGADLPESAPIATKIALYRILQEWLANAWRHAGGVGQSVSVSVDGGMLRVEITDTGPGFDVGSIGVADERLGILGMRERVVSLGGEFRVESEPGRGTRVIATLPTQSLEESDD